ncbi:PAS domain-containing protein [Polymorphospora rubra]|uniref:PAS domain-containing protein n=1 Tax=Polymorphospora rubra TaxID=338584 RepID=UPI00340D1052
MAHVELELTEALPPSSRTPAELAVDDTLRLWSATVSHAAEPCLVIDLETTITAVSRSCCDLLGLGTPAETVGLALLDGRLRLVDFTAARGELTETEIDKIPPLLALTSGRLARGLLRVQSDSSGENVATVDAIATPLSVGGAVAGSLTFFSPV